MEHGSVRDPSSATFCFVDEDHTLANSVRFALNQEYLLYSTLSFYFLFVFFNEIIMVVVALQSKGIILWIQHSSSF